MKLSTQSEGITRTRNVVCNGSKTGITASFDRVEESRADVIHRLRIGCNSVDVIGIECLGNDVVSNLVGSIGVRKALNDFVHRDKQCFVCKNTFLVHKTNSFQDVSDNVNVNMAPKATLENS